MQIKLKSLLEEGIHGKFWWMSPEGVLYPVMKLDPQTGHKEAAKEILIGLGIVPSDNDIFDQMYKFGWLRISYVGNQGYYFVEFTTAPNKSPSNKQMGRLKDLADELGADEVRNSSTKQKYF